MTSEQDLLDARTAAARLLSERGYEREAVMVVAGDGDDFAEVRTALALLRLLAQREDTDAERRAGRFARRLAGEEC